MKVTISDFFIEKVEATKGTVETLYDAVKVVVTLELMVGVA